MRRGPAQLAVFDPATLSLADCVVRVKEIRRGKAWPPAWSAAKRKHDIVLRDEWFEHPVHVLREGTQLVFHNQSPALCWLHGYTRPSDERLANSITIFNFAVPADTAALVVAEAYLEHPGLVWVTDDIDSAKSTWIHVVDTPYVAQPTTRDGRFEITHLPPGTYTIAAWHVAFQLEVQEREGLRPTYVRSAPLVLERLVTVKPGEDMTIDFTFPAP